MRPSTPGTKVQAPHAGGLVDAHGAPVSDPIRVAIAIPSQDMVHAGFAFDLAKLVGFSVANAPEITITLLNNRGTDIASQRHRLVVEAQEAGASHLLFIDSDMRFPKDALFRLLAHGEEFVAVNYPTRRPPIIPTAATADEQHIFLESARSAQPDMLLEVGRCGFGFALIRLPVFEKVAKPWFAFGYAHQNETFIGEDVVFCRKARAKGVKVMIDPNLSREIQHTGALDFAYTHALQTLRAYQAADVKAEEARA